MALTTRSEREALQWMLDRWDTIFRPITSDPERNEKLAAKAALVALMTNEARLKAQHEAACSAPPFTAEELVDTVASAKLVMAAQLAPSPFMTVGFAKALAETR